MSSDATTTGSGGKHWQQAEAAFSSAALAAVLAAGLQTQSAAPPPVVNVPPSTQSTDGSVPFQVKDVSLAMPAKVRTLSEALHAISRLEPGWDDDDAEAPNGIAIANMQQALDDLLGAGLIADRLVASVDGGVSAYFFRNGGHVAVHCDNDGNVVVVDDDPKRGPHAATIDPEARELLEAFVRRHAIG